MKTKNHTSGCTAKTKSNGPWGRPFKVCRTLAMRLNQLREQLISRLAEEVQGRVSEVLVRKALVEAEALAWATQFPLLFLPALAEEKVRNAREWSGRQREVLERQRVLATIL